ncbi:MAG: pantoate--beta-alanine ligase [Betaproteobacteria bacterium]|nr:pantoate--beta-alanine ligase [Betaproteobacteria bacterium]
MQFITTAAELRAQVTAWRRTGQRIALVPTMGNLHAGHYSLVELARANADRVVASLFVNPTQFGPQEDYSRYPRTLEQDRAGLTAHGCDALFAPSVEEMYPFGTMDSVRIEVPKIREPLEGALRPGHFAGVATVVCKLLRVIERLVVDLCMPIEIVAGPTHREADGLAMSSRNQYLSAAERETAATIYRTLVAMRSQWRAGLAFDTIETAALATLRASGFAPDYASIRRAESLEPPGDRRNGLVALIAARLGTTRLIDNLPLDD